MIRLSLLIEGLNKFPADALAHADEGAITCITVFAAGKDDRYGVRFPIGYIVADENDHAFERHALPYGQEEQ